MTLTLVLILAQSVIDKSVLPAFRAVTLILLPSAMAVATVDEEGHIQIESLAPGNATVTVTDRLNKSAEFSVKVIKKLVVDNSEEIAYLTVGEPLTIKILDGNGGYTCTNNGSATYLKCTIAENGTDVIIEGLKRYRFNKTVTIKDQEGESISINIVYIDDLYLENPSYRYLIAGSSSISLSLPRQWVPLLIRKSSICPKLL